MSLLDDSYILENNLSKEALSNYIKTLSISDTPAHWQAWYDLLSQEFIQLPYKEKIVFLEVLLNNLPNHNLWDPNIVYDEKENKYIVKELRVDGLPRLNPEIFKLNGHFLDVVGVSEVLITKSLVYICIKDSIKKLMEYFTFKNADVLTDEMLDIYSVLKKLDPHKSNTELSEVYTTNLCPESIIEQIFLHIGDKCKNWLKDGSFRGNYHTLTDLNFISENMFEYTHVETKYEKIKSVLRQLIEISIKYAN